MHGMSLHRWRVCGAKEEMTLGDDSCTKTKNPSVFNQGVQVW